MEHSTSESCSSDELQVSPESQDAADVAKASIGRYYTNMFKALTEREKRYEYNSLHLVVFLLVADNFSQAREVPAEDGATWFERQ